MRKMLEVEGHRDAAIPAPSLPSITGLNFGVIPPQRFSACLGWFRMRRNDMEEDGGSQLKDKYCAGMCRRGLVFEAHRRVYQSTLGSRVINKRTKKEGEEDPCVREMLEVEGHRNTAVPAPSPLAVGLRFAPSP